MKVRVALRNCGYTEWALKGVEQLGKRHKRMEEELKGQERKKAFLGLLYMTGVTERLQKAYKQHNIQLFLKAGYTIRNTVVCPKDPLDPEDKCGVIYESKFDECGQLYVGEMERSLGERTQEHDKSVKEGDSKSPLSQHQETIRHTVLSKLIIEGVSVIDS